MPIFIFLFFLATRADYISVFWTTPMGFVMLGVMGLLEFLGFIWIRKVVEVKV